MSKFDFELENKLIELGFDIDKTDIQDVLDWLRERDVIVNIRADVEKGKFVYDYEIYFGTEKHLDFSEKSDSYDYIAGRALYTAISGVKLSAKELFTIELRPYVEEFCVYAGQSVIEEQLEKLVTKLFSFITSKWTKCSSDLEDGLHELDKIGRVLVIDGKYIKIEDLLILPENDTTTI